MESVIASYLKMSTQPVAVIKTDVLPEGALMFKEGRWGCVISLLAAAAKGKVAAMSEKTVACKGGAVGTGFKAFELGTIEYFLSVGGRGPKPGEFYKESPELARAYVEGLPRVEAKEYLVFKPLRLVEPEENVTSVIFLVNADQLSALVTLANFDRENQDNVQIKFGAGCAQSLLYSMTADSAKSGTCMIGLTDPSARKCIDRDLLSFTIPFGRFEEMEVKAPGSFLAHETWQQIAKRID